MVEEGREVMLHLRALFLSLKPVTEVHVLDNDESKMIELYEKNTRDLLDVFICHKNDHVFTLVILSSFSLVFLSAFIFPGKVTQTTVEEFS